MSEAGVPRQHDVFGPTRHRSYPCRVKVLLLENIHPVAVETLERHGHEVELRAGSLSESELVEALDGVHPVSYTHLTLPTIYSV